MPNHQLKLCTGIRVEFETKTWNAGDNGHVEFYKRILTCTVLNLTKYREPNWVELLLHMFQSTPFFTFMRCGGEQYI